jgi:hypothetical protein
MSNWSQRPDPLERLTDPITRSRSGSTRSPAGKPEEVFSSPLATLAASP